jgi:exosortase K
MRIKCGVLVVVALIAFALKRHYADASIDALSWILTPTAHLVDLVTGVTFAAVPSEGYFSAERMFLIEKACAGLNFLIAAFTVVAFTLLYRVQSVRTGLAVIGVSLAASYVAAVAVNTVRIVIAMWLAAHPTALSTFTAADIHRLEGIVVYFGGLLLLYELVQRIDRGTHAFGYALPLGCYYLVTIVLPLANGALRLRSGQAGGDVFVAHAVIVILVPPGLILLLWVMRRLLVEPLVGHAHQGGPGETALESGPTCACHLEAVSVPTPSSLSWRRAEWAKSTGLAIRDSIATSPSRFFRSR